MITHTICYRIKKAKPITKPRFKVGKRRHLAHGLPSSNKKSETCVKPRFKVGKRRIERPTPTSRT